MTRPLHARLRQAAILLAGAVALHGALVLIGWWASWSLYVHPPAQSIPMAPSTAAAFLLLSSTLFTRLRAADRSPADRVASAVCWLIAAAGVLNLLLPARLDEILGGGTGQFGSVKLGVMSPVTAATTIVLAAGVARYRRNPRAAAVCATLAVVAGFTIAIGYAYGTPLLYGSSTIPVALPTGLSILLLGTAMILGAGPEVWPLRPLVGDSPRAMMLRAFLPTTAGLITLMGLLFARFGDSFASDRVLVTGWFANAAIFLVALLVSRLARHIGADLEQAYADRHQAERRYQEVFDGTLAGVASTTLEGRVLLCNDAYARIFGFDSPQQLMAHPGGSPALFREPEERGRVLLALREDGRLNNYELRMQRRDGKPVWILANLTLHESAGEEARIESTIIDISERKALEQQLWQAQKMDALGSLAGGVAHDFNNLLTAIMGSAEVMRLDLPVDDPRRPDLDEIDKACGRAAALTRQLLAFSRRQPFEPRALSLGESVHDMKKMIGRLLGPQVSLVTASDQPLASIWADASQIEQVVLNLAVNARDAMPDGGTVTIETRNVRLDEPYRTEHFQVPAGAYVLLAVSDTGTGMDRETLSHIFEPFFTTKEKGKGTGLGLATVYGIVKQSRAYILVYSELGIGTTFKCYFPVTQEEVGPAVPSLGPARVAGQETVMIVEDEPAILALAAAGLRRHGYRVLPASDGETAMRIAATHDGVIHLLLSDGVLSGVRVPELLRRLRLGRPETRVLLMSGYSREAVLQNEALDTPTAFLPKPFSIAQLTSKVREVLDTPAGR